MVATNTQHESGALAKGALVPPDRREAWIDAGWFMLLVIWSAVWCLSAATHLGPTYDEPLHLGAGLETWRSGVPARISTQGNMILPVAVVTLPFYVHEKRTGHAFRDVDELLTSLNQARAMTLGWLWLLLVAATRLGRAVAGPWAGRIAAGLIAADPNFLAHSSLATTDIPLVASLMALTLVTYTGRGGNWPQRIVFPGVWFGIAVMTKISALLFGGIILVALEVSYRVQSGSLVRPVGATLGMWAKQVAGVAARSILAVTAVIVIGCVLTLAISGTAAPGSKPLALALHQMSPDDPLRPRFENLAQSEGLPYAGVAFAFQLWHNSQVWPTFLNGTDYPEGCWFYFPVLLALKLPLPVFVLGVAVLFRFRTAFGPLAVIAMLLLLTTLAAKRQNGIRLVLPVVAIGYVALAVALCRGYVRCGKWMGVGAVVLMAAASLWVWPHGLGYLNQLAGGPSAAHERVNDSNLDWGQGIPDLLKWHRANGEPPLAIWYFGTDPVAERPPFQQIEIEHSAITNEEQFRTLVGPRFLAVGETVLSNKPVGTSARAVAIDTLRKMKPVARTATFAIYDFRNPPGK